MKASGISEIKNELANLPAKELAALCLQLAKYKKDNKELLAYLLFESGDKPGFISEVKSLIDEGFGTLDARDNLYFLKKSIRKILRDGHTLAAALSLQAGLHPLDDAPFQSQPKSIKVDITSLKSPNLRPA